MTRVVVEPDESFESALKPFKTSCERKALTARKKAERWERTTD